MRAISNSQAHATPIIALSGMTSAYARTPAPRTPANENAAATGIPKQIATSKCQAFGTSTSAAGAARRGTSRPYSGGGSTRASRIGARGYRISERSWPTVGLRIARASEVPDDLNAMSSRAAPAAQPRHR
jgi:hypothetical protein